MRIPMGRGVVYSSFSLFILGVMFILLGLLSRVADVLQVRVNETFFIVLGVLAGAATIVLWLSPRWKRRFSLFIDENFYVNRHDYRRQWERLSRQVRPTLDRGELVKSVCGTLRPMLHASEVYLAILNPITGHYNVYDRDSNLVPNFTPAASGSLATLLSKRAAAVSLRELEADIELIPGYLEHKDVLSSLGISSMAPMISGDELVGILLFSGTRHGGPYSPEDMSLMTVIGTEIANALYGHLLLREVEERREGEALVTLSSFVLHDLKNCISAIQGVVDGARQHLDRPGFRDELLLSLASVGQRMVGLMDRLSQVHDSPRPATRQETPCGLDAILAGALEHSGAEKASGIKVQLDVPNGLVTLGDPSMLEQVFVNLLRNSVDAMPRGGVLVVRGWWGENGGDVSVEIEDTGCGMSPQFVAESLFRPFVSTKDNGLGIGLYQSKNIVEEHGGHIVVDSDVERGTRIVVSLPAITEARAEECRTVS
jgi:putative PEP-CTERM system histidine kinase